MANANRSSSNGNRSLPTHSVANERLETILDSARLGVWDWNLLSNRVIHDRRWCEMLGLDPATTPDDLSVWETRIHPDDKDECDSAIQNHLRGESEIYENVHRMRHTDGRWIWILDRGRIVERDEVGKPTRFVGTHLDVTKMKESEHINRALQASAKIGGWELDVQSGRTYWTEEVYRIYAIHPGTPTDKIQGINYYAERDRARITHDVTSCIAGQPYRGVYDFVDAQGTAKRVEAFGQPIFDSNGKVYKLTGTFQDISEREAIRREMATLLKVLELAVEGANLGVWQWDLSTNQVHYSAKWAELRGLRLSDLKGTLEDWEASTHPEDVPIAFGKIEEYLSGKTPLYECEFRAKHTNGEWRNIIGRAKISEWDAQGKPLRIAGTDFDITEVKRVQEQLRQETVLAAQAAKFASLGKLSAGIAHEINNPLAIVLTSVETLAQSISNPEKFEKRVDSVRRAGRRIEKIVRSLRRFSRTDEEKQRVEADLAKIISDSLDLLDAQRRHSGVEIEMRLEAGLVISCDPVEIEQVFINLIGNAIDATQAQSKRWVRIQLMRSDGKALIRIMDSGPGVPVDLETKIFDPFFTTKQLGKGTGLGLSISKGILEDHGAQIFLNRSVSSSCFEVRFAVADKLATP